MKTPRSQQTRLRPPLLNSKIAGGIIKDHSLPEMAAVLASIDRMSSVYDALDAVRSTDDPTLTAEARAVRYRQAWERSAAVTTAEVRGIAEKIAAAQEKVRHDARGKAGLLADYGSAKEIRDAIRAMSPKDRNKAILSAFEHGDYEVVTALQANELLIGNPDLPLGTMTEHFIATRAPEEAAKLQEFSNGLRELDMAYSEFAKAVENMRDLPAEKRADDGTKAAKLAEAALGLALQGTAT